MNTTITDAEKDRRIAVLEIQLIYANDAACKGEEGRKMGAAYDECQKEVAELREIAKGLSTRLNVWCKCYPAQTEQNDWDTIARYTQWLAANPDGK